MKKSTSRGFSLLELMFGLAIFAMVLGFGIPSFREMAASGRVTASTNELVTAISFTRSEAMKRGAAIVLCPANAAMNACSGTTTWSTGLVAFVDNGATVGVMDTGEEIVQVWSPFDNVASTNYTSKTYLRYEGDGTPLPTSASKFDLAQTSSGKYPRCIVISPGGQLKLNKGVVCS